ncbi:hypothetical protein RIEGSTA812A_PEG_430 [invertebrate metagenome]|uniref:Uncharacterized protein n=1 Tax=invertebrate metagenome TaxID=1711999 RepID=A0A484H515_9ZZZZ
MPGLLPPSFTEAFHAVNPVGRTLDRLTRDSVRISSCFVFSRAVTMANILL